MHERLQLRIALHGAIVLLAGLLAGIPFGSAITQGKGEATVHAWHVAHTGGVNGGLMILVLGALLPRLAVPGGAATTFLWSLVLTGYAFVVGAVVAASAGVRGLAPGGSAANVVAWAGFTLSGVASLVAAGLAIYGAMTALSR